MAAALLGAAASISSPWPSTTYTVVALVFTILGIVALIAAAVVVARSESVKARLKLLKDANADYKDRNEQLEARVDTLEELVKKQAEKIEALTGLVSQSTAVAELSSRMDGRFDELLQALGKARGHERRGPSQRA